MLLSDIHDAVDNLTLLFVCDRHLFNAHVGKVEDFKHGVAVIIDSFCGPFNGLVKERLVAFTATSGAADEMNRRWRIEVWIAWVCGTIANLQIVNRPHALITVFMRAENQVDTLLVKKLLKAEHVHIAVGNLYAHANHIFRIVAMSWLVAV